MTQGQWQQGWAEKSSTAIAGLKAYCVLCLVCFLVPALAYGDNANIRKSESNSSTTNSVLIPKALVFSPQLKTAYYRSIFANIIRGIHDASSGNIAVEAIPEDVANFRADEKIRQHSPDFVISLGSRGKVAAFSISTAIPVVLGAVLSPDSSVLLALQQPSMLASTAFTPLRQPRLPDLTVSLTPAPEQLFNQLRNLAPNIRGVHVVYHKNDTELINDARAAAKRLGLNLTVHQAQNLKQSALAHSKLMANLKSATEALWLL
ncbi:MAG: hypothetical protein COA42_24150, partial [Alteromonadaceae bacterium]